MSRVDFQKESVSQGPHSTGKTGKMSEKYSCLVKGRELQGSKDKGHCDIYRKIFEVLKVSLAYKIVANFLN